MHTRGQEREKGVEGNLKEQEFSLLSSSALKPCSQRADDGNEMNLLAVVINTANVIGSASFDNSLDNHGVCQLPVAIATIAQRFFRTNGAWINVELPA